MEEVGAEKAGPGEDAEGAVVSAGGGEAPNGALPDPGPAEHAKTSETDAAAPNEVTAVMPNERAFGTSLCLFTTESIVPWSIAPG
jgi:hypothetical protein